MGIKTDVATMKKSREVHLKLKIEPPYEPAISFLDTYPKNKTKKKTPSKKREIKKEICTHTHIPPFNRALFIVSKIWKQCKCPSMYG